MNPALVTFRAIGQFSRSDVTARWIDRARPSNGEIDGLIEQAWREAQSRPGINLFDGSMCRLERFRAGKTLELDLSPTTYKIFWGTNLAHPEIAARCGAEFLANPIGLSCALESSDGYLMLGRRNASLAYYPGRIHPFAGSLESAAQVDVFANIERELAEELAFTGLDISGIVCIGLIEDNSLHQPELIFHVNSTRSRARIEKTLDAAEHDACVAIESKAEALETALKNPLLTPVALGTALLWGRSHFGAAWFDAANRAVNLGRQ